MKKVYVFISLFLLIQLMPQNYCLSQVNCVMELGPGDGVTIDYPSVIYEPNPFGGHVYDDGSFSTYNYDGQNAINVDFVGICGLENYDNVDRDQLIEYLIGQRVRRAVDHFNITSFPAIITAFIPACWSENIISGCLVLTECLNATCCIRKYTVYKVGGEIVISHVQELQSYQGDCSQSTHPEGYSSCELKCSATNLPIGVPLSPNTFDCLSECYWKVNGNEYTTDENFLGTTTGNNNPLIIKTNGIPRMRVGEDGRVIIGSKKLTEPVPQGLEDHTDYTLGVYGKIVTNEIVGLPDNNYWETWPDFVFKEGYKLTPLIELEKDIKANHHLPGIPSIEEAKVNGVNVLEMQAKLLQKIEELTLYMIELKKENETLKRQIEEKK